MTRTPASASSLLAALAMTVLVLLAMSPVSAQGNGASEGTGNTGTIKVHDEETASPAQRNEPHVDCDDFWVEGFRMAADSGNLTFYSWPPTGDKAVVLEADWSADHGTPKNHFLAGPFTLAAGHYRVEATDVDKKDGTSHVKTKVFWVEECESEETPEEPLACPADLAAVANPDGSVTLTWTDADGSDGTNVYRALGDGDFVYLTTVDPGLEEYVDLNPQANQGYSYLVTGLFGSEESEDCPLVEVTTIPELPTPLAIGLAAGGGVAALALFGRRRKP
jgi:hypothetical protein